jgi:hypothetical protein
MGEGSGPDRPNGSTRHDVHQRPRIPQKKSRSRSTHDHTPLFPQEDDEHQRSRRPAQDRPERTGPESGRPHSEALEVGDDLTLQR